MARPIADADSVAIRVGVDDTACRNRAAGATDGFDDDGLVERVAHRIADNARERICRAAGWKSHHHGNRARWIDLCPGKTKCSRQCYRACDQVEKSTAGKLHDIAPDLQRGRRCPRTNVDLFFKPAGGTTAAFDFKDRRRVPAVSSQSGYTSPLAICRGRCRTFAAVHEPASGTKRTSQSTQLMSAFGGKADIARVAINVRF